MERQNEQTPVILAPMAGITDCVFRRICFEQGCTGATTEMISAQGYLSAPRMLKAYGDLIKTLPGEGTVFAQVFGREPKWFGMAVSAITELGIFSGIDINMGCPAHKVTGGGNGSALMRDPKLCGEIVKACVEATVLPVTVKMRLGWDENEITCLDVAKAAEQNGAAALTVHGRTRSQFYAGKADREWIGRVKRHVSIPVIGNGDIDSGESALDMLRTTGCDGIAVGRAALGNPWIFAEIRAALKGEKYTRPSYAEVIETALRQAREMADWKGEKRAVLEMRKHFSWYIAGRRGAAKLRPRINQAETLHEVEGLLRSLDDRE
ncbi:MAG: tRNA dihydrouridine synthase DusB [Clostridia bacterium]|nr:tRNA dihydrouridine synthase DusB [Clostridia bacterium]